MLEQIRFVAEFSFGCHYLHIYPFNGQISSDIENKTFTAVRSYSFTIYEV